MDFKIDICCLIFKLAHPFELINLRNRHVSPTHGRLPDAGRVHGYKLLNKITAEAAAVESFLEASTALANRVTFLPVNRLLTTLLLIPKPLQGGVGVSIPHQHSMGRWHGAPTYSRSRLLSSAASAV